MYFKKSLIFCVFFWKVTDNAMTIQHGNMLKWIWFTNDKYIE